MKFLKEESTRASDPVGRNYMRAWTFWVLLIAASECGWAQLSPGRLSKAHQSLEGPTKCVACHSFGAFKANFKCLGCHREIRERLNARRGLHPALVREGDARRECFHCHAEHQGETFVPIRWDVDLDEFDHGKTGYVLEGSHRGVPCRKCHTPKNIPAAVRRRLIAKDLTRTYLGLSRECSSCHGDEHRTQALSDCLRCHTYSKWKPASRFNHAGARFALEGAHQKVACAKCHPKTGDPKPYARFAGLKFSSCDECHKDPHRAAFPGPCRSCHAVEGWKPARVVASGFDHSRTHFPLEDKHSTLPCGKCHATVNFKQPIAHGKCRDCHKTELHGGQFASRMDGGECSACHSLKGWNPTTFSAVAHRGTRYPLEGRHASVSCAKCHVPAGQNTLYRVKHEHCADCHQDPHGGQFAAQHLGRCEDCHAVRGFRPSTYSVARHSESRFPLTSAHLAIPCRECHYKGAASQSPSGRFRFSDTSCGQCHDDPHQGQFKKLLAARGGRGDCDSCHSPRTWRETPNFDHLATSFPLKGTHRGTPCMKCHKAAGPASSIKSVVFAAVPKLCSGCHPDVHGGQFQSSAGGGECVRCHAPLEWKPASFDHERASTFALTGAHRGVPCAECHKTRQQVNGRDIMRFKPTPRECTGCHGTQITG